MTNQQGAPEALRLADRLASNTGHVGGPTMDAAAAELRRLQAENERLAALVEAQQPAPSAAAAVEQETDAVAKRRAKYLRNDTDAGRAYVAQYLRSMGQHYFDDYIQTDLAGDFACALASALSLSMAQQAPKPSPTPQADSVLEDAARLDWLALAGPTSICVVIDRPHDSEVEVSTDDVTGYGKTLREALDAARKQGANHD